ncbi:MAG: rhomboid family intramembrane serine protease [Thermoplasmatales archaeon]|nr:rhomboid family intramembrane serine protease [Thermoplasmatales archaeon]
MADVTIVIDSTLPIISIIAICIMIATLIIFSYKKWMLSYGIIIANFLVFILSMIYENDIFGITSVNIVENQILMGPAGLGFRPFYLTPELAHQSYTIFTSMFIHGGFLHIIGNMLVFFFVGIAFEERIGWKKFILIYLIAGIGAALTQSLINIAFPTQFDPNSFASFANYQQVQLLSDAGGIPLVGASGAIFGILGAFAFSYPRDKVAMPIPLGFFMIIRRVKVIYAVILFAAIETIIVLLEVQDSTAHYAHLGGLISGFILAVLLLRKQKTHTKEGKTVYYDSYKPVEISKEDYSELKKLATTPELKEIYNKIKNEDVPQVRDTWLEHFLEKTVCPKCKKPLHSFDNNVWCEYCGFRTKI